MAVREALNRNPVVVAAAVVVVIAAACLAVFLRLSDRDSTSDGSAVPKAWYTVDDGRTWFAGPGNKVSPFDNGGKLAYRCYVWTTDGGKTKFVSHLERLKPEVRQKYGPQAEVEPWNLPPGAEQVKPPLSGDAGWLPEDAPQAAQLMMPQVPEGKGNLEAVLAQ